MRLPLLEPEKVGVADAEDGYTVLNCRRLDRAAECHNGNLMPSFGLFFGKRGDKTFRSAAEIRRIKNIEVKDSHGRSTGKPVGFRLKLRLLAISRMGTHFRSLVHEIFGFNKKAPLALNRPVPSLTASIQLHPGLVL